jgi:ribonuclease-3
MDGEKMSNKVMSESYSKLRWNVQGLFDNFSVIRNELDAQLASLPEASTRKKNKLQRLIYQIKEMEDTIQDIKNNKITEIENHLDHKFTEPNLVILAFFHQDAKSLFAELKNHPFSKENNFDFESYLNLDEAAKVLALIGDSAISLAMIHVLWNPNISSTGELTVKRSEFVSNKNMAKLCDKWNLFDFRLGSTKNTEDANEEKIEHAKGTIIEALYGVLYIECGLDKIISSVIHLK